MTSRKTHSRPRIVLLALLTAAASLAIAACGGDDSGEPESEAVAADVPAGEVTITSGPTDNEVPDLEVKESKSGGTGLLRFEMTRLNGESDDISQYAGDVVLIVNTASECGFTPQFQGLQDLYEDRRKDGLVILGFPANDFAGQEPRSNEEIADFCEANFGVEFPMFAKTVVTGPDANPLFKELPEPGWNFNKYLLDREGNLVANWGSNTEPTGPEITGQIDQLLSS